MPRHALILGGHGKIAQHLTRQLLAKSWTITSVIRAEDQVPAIKKLEPSGGGGKLNVLVRSIEEVTDVGRAQAILDEVKPDTVVFSAGAGGKGGPERTFLIDRDAASNFVKAAVATPTVTKFILISYLASRRAKPSWWDDAAWSDANAVNQQLANYFKAKVVADEVLYEESAKRPSDFAGISLRPGTLTEEPVGKVVLGRTPGAKGNASREAVAAVAAALAENDGAKTSWLDLYDGGEEGVEDAVARVVREGVDVAEGEEVYDKVHKA